MMMMTMTTIVQFTNKVVKMLSYTASRTNESGREESSKLERAKDDEESHMLQSTATTSSSHEAH